MLLLLEQGMIAYVIPAPGKMHFILFGSAQGINDMKGIGRRRHFSRAIATVVRPHIPKINKDVIAIITIISCSTLNLFELLFYLTQSSQTEIPTSTLLR